MRPDPMAICTAVKISMDRTDAICTVTRADFSVILDSIKQRAREERRQGALVRRVQDKALRFVSYWTEQESNRLTR